MFDISFEKSFFCKCTKLLCREACIVGAEVNRKRGKAARHCFGLFFCRQRHLIAGEYHYRILFAAVERQPAHFKLKFIIVAAVYDYLPVEASRNRADCSTDFLTQVKNTVFIAFAFPV